MNSTQRTTTKPAARRIAAAIATITTVLIAATGCQQRVTSWVLELTSTVHALDGLLEAIATLG